MGEYLATFYILNAPKKVPKNAVGLDAIILSHRFTAMTGLEVEEQKEAKLEELRLEYKDALRIKLVSAMPAPESQE